MRRLLPPAGLLLAALAIPALAQVPAPPSPSWDAVKEHLYTWTSAVYLIATIITIIIAVLKVIYGGTLRASGAPGIAVRGATELFEGFLGAFWYLLAIVVLPWVIYFLSVANVIPGWIASEVMQALLKIIWRQ